MRGKDGERSGASEAALLPHGTAQHYLVSVLSGVRRLLHSSEH